MIKKNILIISATSKNNLELAEKIQSIIDTSIVDSEVLNLDKHCLPIFTEIFFHKNKNSYLLEAKFITDKFVNADGIIVCSPEYNGSIPPIVRILLHGFQCLQNIGVMDLIIKLDYFVHIVVAKQQNSLLQ